MSRSLAASLGFLLVVVFQVSIYLLVGTLFYLMMKNMTRGPASRSPGLLRLARAMRVDTRPSGESLAAQLLFRLTALAPVWFVTLIVASSLLESAVRRSVGPGAAGPDLMRQPLVAILCVAYAAALVLALGYRFVMFPRAMARARGVQSGHAAEGGDTSAVVFGRGQLLIWVMLDSAGIFALGLGAIVGAPWVAVVLWSVCVLAMVIAVPRRGKFLSSAPPDEGFSSPE
jgi:fumarate reductase subunit C